VISVVSAKRRKKHWPYSLTKALPTEGIEAKKEDVDD